MLKPNQAIVKHQSVFGPSDYFIAEITKKKGIYVINQIDIHIDKALETIKCLKIDFSSNHVTGYCNPNMSFRNKWKLIPDDKKTKYYKL